MHFLKKLVIVAVGAMAFIAVSASSTMAAGFTYSATGTIAGKAVTTQTFATSAGQVSCAVAETSGTIVSTSSGELHVTVNYKSCTAFGFFTADVSPATYLLTASGKADLKSAVTINATGAGCHQTIGAQTLSPVSYANGTSGEPPKANGKLKVTTSATSISYTTTGGLCGAAGNNLTLNGAIEIERVGGGTIGFDA